MSDHSYIYILIPVYNEARNILKLIASLKLLCSELQDSFNVCIILIDDGSQDQTSVLAEEVSVGFNLVILKHKKNLGPGRAFGTGFSYISSKLKVSDLVLTMEGDNTSKIDLVKQMLLRLREGFDVILASPYLYGGRIEHTSTYRIFLSSMANLFIKELLGIHGIFTVSSFFRIYRATIIKMLQSLFGVEIIERDGFECMTELIIKMVYLNVKISEIAMVLDMRDRVGKSRMRILRTIRGYITLWFLKGNWRKTILQDVFSEK